MVSIVSIDNYEELVKNVSDSEKATLLAAIDNRIGEWAKDIHGVLRKYDRDKYIFVIPHRRSGLGLCRQQLVHLSGSSMILNDEVSSNAIMKRATRHYTVVIKPLNNG